MLRVKLEIYQLIQPAPANYIQLPNDVELDTSGNYRDRTSHNKKKTLFGILIP